MKPRFGDPQRPRLRLRVKRFGIAKCVAHPAIAEFREAERLKPGYAEAMNNRGMALREQDKNEEGMACFREAIQHKPGYADPHYNLGNALRDELRFEEAIVSYEEALRLRPG